MVNHLNVVIKKEDLDLYEGQLVLVQPGLSGQRQEPKPLPAADQLGELGGLGVKVLQWEGRGRLELQRAPLLWNKEGPSFRTEHPSNFFTG